MKKLNKWRDFLKITPPDGPSELVLPIPTNITNNSTVLLQCGTTYQGTLDLSGKSNVTVRTEGTCGKASITPGKAVTGWTLYQGNIYSAPIGFTPVQVAVDGKPVDAAHWPNRPQIWATGGSSVPNSDLIGATLVVKTTAYRINVSTLASNTVTTTLPFYVEGKLWMLDTPGEWAVSNGRLYMWAPNGLSPEGRVWAAADSDNVSVNNTSSALSDLSSLGINANDSSGITINNVKVFSASDGISGANSTNLHIQNTDVTNSSRDGIYASNSTGLVIDSSTFTNSVRAGIGGWYSKGSIITNNTVTTSGMVGMPRSGSGIFFGNTSDNIRIDNNRVLNTSYNGIEAYKNSTISNNVVDGACLVLTDGGAIYTNGRTAGYVPLNLLIKGNTIRNVLLDGSKGIYLDDSSSYVTVTGNNISNTPSGLFIHDGSNNTATYNTFSSNVKHHASLALTSSNNVFTNNTFNSTRNELTFDLGGTNVTTYGTFDYNTYTTTDINRFAAASGIKSYTDWKSYMGQDAHSTMNGI